MTAQMVAQILLFTRITKAGTYFIRVRAFGKQGLDLLLKVTRLQPV